MNKVALITFHDTTNFGALLQTFGLYKKLNDMGYDCNILDYQCASDQLVHEIPTTFEFSLNPRKLASEFLLNSKKRKRYAAMQQFSDSYIPKKSQRYDRSTVFDIKEDYDAYVVGSDMCWGLDITDGDYSYFLDFVADDKRKFSYGPSIGKRDWTPEEKKKIGDLLARFHTVSVREEKTVERLSPVLNGKSCQVVCDPTMLLTATEWQPYIGKRLCKKDYVVLYFDTDDHKCLNDAKAYAKKHGKKLLVISKMPSFVTKTHNVFPYKVEDFLSLLYYADTVFTASYHGMLFALYFHKNLVYFNRQPGYRMETVAKRMNLGGREGRIVDFDHLPPLNYTDIDHRMEGYRQESIAYLKEALA